MIFWFFMAALVLGIGWLLLVLQRRNRRSGPLPADHKPDGIDFGRDPTAGARSNDHIAGHHGDLHGGGGHP